MEETELIEANPRNAHIRPQNGKETVLSPRNLAAASLVQNYPPKMQLGPEQKTSTLNKIEFITVTLVNEITTLLRWSECSHKSSDRLMYE